MGYILNDRMSLKILKLALLIIVKAKKMVALVDSLRHTGFCNLFVLKDLFLTTDQRKEKTINNAMVRTSYIEYK